MMKLGNKNITWNDIAKVLNDEYEENNTANKYKKEFHRKYSSAAAEASDINLGIYDQIQDQLGRLREEKTTLKDLQSDVNRQLRRIDREENIKEIALEYAEIMKKESNSFRIIKKHTKRNQEKVGLLLLGDWHYGLEIDEYQNCYNTEVCKERLGNILDQTINLCKKEEVTDLVIFNLSDLISGRIHAQLRMQSRIDAITQTMEVAELIRDFIELLSEELNIEYHDCLDNHSRIEPNKKESLQLENFTRIIHWYLKASLDNNPNVIISEEAEDIITAGIFNHLVVGVHGDKDNPVTIVSKLSSFLGVRPDLICLGHRHHFQVDEENGCTVVMNPSLMGPDQFSLSLRKTGTPAQSLIIITEDNPTHCIYKLNA